MHSMVDHSLMVHLLVKKLLIKVVLLFPDGVDTLKVVHVLNGARTAARYVGVSRPCRGLRSVVSAHLMLSFKRASLKL